MDKASTSPSIRGTSPPLNDIEFEIALLRSVVQFKPTGKDKDVIIVSLQAEMHRKSGLLLEIGDLWARLGEMYDLEALEELANSSSDSQAPSPPPRMDRSSVSPLSSPSPSPSPLPPPRSVEETAGDERRKLKPGGREDSRRVSDRSKGSSKSKGKPEKVEDAADEVDAEDELADAGPSRLKRGRPSNTDRRRSITAASGATPASMSGRKGRDRSSSLSEDEAEDETKKAKKGTGKRKRDSVDQEPSKSKVKRGEEEGQERRRRRR